MSLCASISVLIKTSKIAKKLDDMNVIKILYIVYEQPAHS